METRQVATRGPAQRPLSSGSVTGLQHHGLHTGILGISEFVGRGFSFSKELCLWATAHQFSFGGWSVGWIVKFGGGRTGKGGVDP